MKKDKISIIIPIYNSIDYISRCLKSVQEQTYENLEVICIDDGSSDGTAEIVDDFAKMDKRFIVIHQSNKGESNARNTGLKTMTGTYIAFIDCDDWIEPQMYEVLEKYIREKKVDMVASSWFRDTDSESVEIKNSVSVEEDVFNRESLLQYIYMRDSYRGFSYMWNKLYRRDLFFDNEENLILFDEGLKLGGDVLYLARLVLNTKTAYYIERAFYHYYQRKISSCHTKDISKLRDWLIAYQKVIRYINDNNIETKALIWIKRFLVYHSSNVAEFAYEQKNKSALVECQNIMKMYENEYKKTNLDNLERLKRYEHIVSYKL